MMNWDYTVDHLRQLAARTGATYSQLAVLAGVSPSTLRGVFVHGDCPTRERPRDRIDRFVRANRDVTTRSALHAIE